ncbi:site-specific integrase [Rubellimicrobium aerolatum]|uniref:Tyrosine-type recombinase/integrase n=1 Tax=Rubellimicrobium aerolatum TaxID=490979 RepID=A0ABW0SH02_9RHOB|nr:site-specific integrase [Rubellimicrobium aerolatum]MBP1807661.1 integrase [Rubellimicrobium aerolatum]
MFDQPNSRPPCTHSDEPLNAGLSRPVPDTAVFQNPARISLAQVLCAVEAQLEGAVRRDTRSAFAALERAGVDLIGTLATPDRVRTVLDGLSPGSLGVSEKRLANIRSLVVGAVKQFGQRRICITREIPPSPEWVELLASIPERNLRWGLGRLACFCTVKGTRPEGVQVETLQGLFAALEAEELVKDPCNTLKHTIAVWNICRKRVPGWPDIRLASPSKTAPAMLSLEAFPASFRADVIAWEERMRHPDLLDPTAPVRPLREPTLKGYQFTFRRVASALVRAGTVPAAAMVGLAVLVQPEHFTTGLREYLPEEGSKRTTDYAHKMATQLIVVARMHLAFNEGQLRALQAIADRIKPKGGRRMGERNRERLHQFDDPAVVQRFLRFPEQELARALRQTNPFRRAKGVERALAISFEIFTGLRVKNLRSLHLTRDLRRSGGRVFLQIPDEEMKTGRRLDLELPANTIALLDAFLRDHRGRLPGAEGPYLFPGEDSGPRSYDAMSEALGEPLRTHAGITVSPHLYRHIIAKIVVERHPELALDVSRRLGHASINTTFQSYLGTEGPAASRRINALLQRVRDGKGDMS